MNPIEVRSLAKQFGSVHAVRAMSLSVAEGDIYALMGPNGAGKSTLIKMLMNLIRPTSGEAWMLGGSVEYLRGDRLERIGYVSENQKMPDWMTVSMALDYWRPFYPTWDRHLERDLVKRLEIPMNRKLKSMSRGARMKAALVSVLAYRPALIVLDEPLSGLDPLVRDELMEALLGLASNATVLFSSHDLAEIEHFANHVGYMADGRLLMSESIERVRKRFCRIEIDIPASTETLFSTEKPFSPPSQWLRFAIDGARAKWDEAHYDADVSLRRAREVFGDVEVTVRSLTLREVFLSLAQEGRIERQEGAAR